MERHPLLKELVDICSTHNVDISRAYTTFEVYFELSDVRKISDLQYYFDETLKKFYLTGKKVTSDGLPDVYIPVMVDDELTPEEMGIIQETVCPQGKQFFLVIRDRDSSSTYYSVKRGLTVPESPETCKRRKELEGKKYQFDKNIQSNRKFLYSKALQNKHFGSDVSNGQKQPLTMNRQYHRTIVTQIFLLQQSTWQ